MKFFDKIEEFFDVKKEYLDEIYKLNMIRIF